MQAGVRSRTRACGWRAAAAGAETRKTVSWTAPSDAHRVMLLSGERRWGSLGSMRARVVHATVKRAGVHEAAMELVRMTGVVGWSVRGRGLRDRFTLQGEN